MGSSTKNAVKTIRDISYYRQRHQNRVFAKLMEFISEQSQKGQVTQKDMAERIRKDPAQLSRLLKHPSNLTLDTISDLLLAFDAEAEPPAIVEFQDRRPANYMHPLIAKILNSVPADGPKVSSTSEKEAPLPFFDPSNDFRIEVKPPRATAGALG